MTKATIQHDPMGHLVDALVEDILATPEAQLLAESAEDHGDPRALAAEFDRIATSGSWNVGATKVGADVATRARPTTRRPSVSWRPAWLEGLWQDLSSIGSGRLAPGGLQIAAASLFLVALSGIAVLHWANPMPSEPAEQLTNATTPATSEKPAVRAESLSRSIVSYLVLLPEKPTAEAALASYRDLQGRYPALLGGRDPIIRGQVGTRGEHVYVAGVGPFTKADQANTLCVELKRAGAACNVGEAGR